MDVDRTRRAVIGALLAGGLGATRLPPVRGLPDRFAPLSGTTWETGIRSVPGTVESPHGPAEVTYDDHGVPLVEAEDDVALAYALGFVQAADRLFQMDLFRRLVAGRLSAVVGERAVASDRFNVQMDFLGAAEVGWAHLRDAPHADALRAYADGVNAYVDDGPLPPEFGLLGYRPEPWSPVDTLLIEKLIAWGLSGSFSALRRSVAREALDEGLFDALFPDRHDHDVPILRGATVAAPGETARRTSGRVNADGSDVGPALAGWLGRFEPPSGVGSNSWVVSGEHTSSGAPLLANDPHLQLSVPPVWYEQQLRTPHLRVQGVAFPGVPFVVVGTNHAGAWGFTNAGTDTIGFYRYDIDGDRYRYRGEWRPIETATRTIEVADGQDREVTVRKTVHGPLLERQGERVGVAWIGHTATRTSLAIYRLSRADGLEDVLEAVRDMTGPSQNLVYADRDGNTLYQLVGRHPIRRVDGERVPGNRVFDGSAGEAEWVGFEPFGVSSWEGFVPFEELPRAVNAPYVATANQRIVDDGPPYLQGPYAAPYRARRLYRRLDERAGSDRPMDGDFMARLQRDVVDGRAVDLVPTLLAAVADRPELADAAATLEAWDRRMTPDARGALLFARWFEHYEAAVYDPLLEGADLDDSFRPSAWVTAHLDPDGPVFAGRDRDAVMTDALGAAVEEVDAAGWVTYGDYSHTGAMTHPFELGFLNYPRLPAPGSPYTLRNYDVEGPTGSSWRMLVDLDDGSARGSLPGGNDGVFFGRHYDDRLRAWVAGRYAPLGRPPTGEPAIVFRGDPT